MSLLSMYLFRSHLLEYGGTMIDSDRIDKTIYIALHIGLSHRSAAAFVPTIEYGQTKRAGRLPLIIIRKIRSLFASPADNSIDFNSIASKTKKRTTAATIGQQLHHDKEKIGYRSQKKKVKLNNTKQWSETLKGRGEEPCRVQKWNFPWP